MVGVTPGGQGRGGRSEVKKPAGLARRPGIEIPHMESNGAIHVSIRALDERGRRPKAADTKLDP